MRTVCATDGTAIAFDQPGAGRAVILVGGTLGVRTHSMFTTWPRCWRRTAPCSPTTSPTTVAGAAIAATQRRMLLRARSKISTP
jgi:hypothetical protein